MGIPPFCLVGAAGGKFGSASVGAYMAGFFTKSFLLQPAEQPTAAEMASLEGKTLKLGGFSVLGTPSWQTVGLLDGYKMELGGFVQRCDVGRSGRKPA